MSESQAHRATSGSNPLSAAAADPHQAYDCIKCEAKNDPRYSHKMKMTFGVVNDGDDLSCDECEEALQPGTEYFQCNRNSGGLVRCCGRIVCGKCIDLCRHLRSNSRWHHDEPEWKSTLFGCDEQPELTICTCMCQYMFCGHANVVQVARNPHDFFDGSACNFCVLGTIGCFCLPLAFLHEFVGEIIIVRAVDAAQDLLQERFGVEPMGCCTVRLCRWCALARVKREATLRGYMQPYFCGPSLEERREARPQPPTVSMIGV